MGVSDEEIHDLKLRAHVIAVSAQQMQEDIDAILAQIKRLDDDLNRVAGTRGPRVMDDEELEESARQVRNKKFVGAKAIALRLLRELDKGEYPSLHLLMAFHKSLGEELNRIYATGYR
jgi:hypothetical protein